MVLRYGTDSNEATVLTVADARRAITELKKQIHALERLKGTAVILMDGAVVSVYRPGRKRMRQFLGLGKSHRHSRDNAA